MLDLFIFSNKIKYYSVHEEEKKTILKSAARDLHDVEQTLIKHVAMELRDEEPYQFIRAYTGGNFIV